MTNTITTNHSLIRAARAGLLAAALMGAAAMMLAPLAGLGFWEPLRLIASPLLGRAALEGVLPVFVGLMLHMMMGAALGVAYVYLVPKGAWGPLGGLAYGLLVWAGATLVMGHLAPLLARLMPYWVFAAAHLVYGASLGWLLRPLGERG